MYQITGDRAAAQTGESMKQTLNISTGSRSEMKNITREVQRIIDSSGITDGFCMVFNPHTTAALTINEQADPDVVLDMLGHLDRQIPWHAGYAHAEGNSAAHIKASLFGGSLNVMVENGRLVLGTWQGIFFCEFDGPRQRKIYVKAVPDA